jgi:hypothetical protein
MLVTVHMLYTDYAKLYKQDTIIILQMKNGQTERLNNLPPLVYLANGRPGHKLRQPGSRVPTGDAWAGVRLYPQKGLLERLALVWPPRTWIWEFPTCPVPRLLAQTMCFIPQQLLCSLECGILGCAR